MDLHLPRTPTLCKPKKEPCRLSPLSVGQAPNVRVHLGLRIPLKSICQAPAPNSSAQAIFAQDGTRTLGEGDIFLSGDWRERWCLCDLCLPRLQEHPYLLKEDDTYEPPEDPDSGKLQSVVDVGRTENGFVGLSLEELGLRALERIPRDRALDGIRAFNSMRYVLRQYFPKYLGITI
jgi:E3 ubiquitin-protein ligase UBR7